MSARDIPVITWPCAAVEIDVEDDGVEGAVGAGVDVDDEGNADVTDAVTDALAAGVVGVATSSP